MLYSGGTPQIGDAIPAVATIGPPPPPVSAPMGLAPVGRVGSPLSAAEAAAIRADQGALCAAAMRAKASNSPAYGSLSAQCGARRRANVAARIYVPDDMSPNDPAYRVALTSAGEEVIGRDPALQSRRAQLQGDRARGFTMAQGVRAGRVDPAFVAWVQTGLLAPSELSAGFNDALSEPAGGNVQAGNQGGGDEGGIPKPVLIAGAAVGVLGVAALVFKLTRKR